MCKPPFAIAYRLIVIGAALALAACNGRFRPILSIGGSITGLNAAGLVLQNNAVDRVMIAAGATSFSFSARAGSQYDITVAAQPTGQTCAVTDGAGRNVKRNINNIQITCTAVTFTISGTVAGLTASGLVLQNNGGDDLAIDANAITFEFTTPVTYGDSYTVTVSTQPAGQSCSIVGGSGTATAEVNVALTCTNMQFVRFDGHSAILSDERLARDPVTAVPLNFVFVDNTNNVSPDGTSQHPYPTLDLAEANSAPADIIYVFPGDGTTTGMDSGPTLQASQKFWGAGISHVIQTSDGNVSIPASAQSAPKITSIGPYSLTLSTDNEVSGFIFQNAVGGAIFGADPGSVNISSNTFDGNTSVSSAPIIVTASNGPISAVVDNNTITGNTVGAIHFSLNDTDATLSITNNTITNNGTGALGPYGAAILIDPSGSSSGNCHLLLSHNTISGNTGSALYDANGGFDDFQVTASDNTITGNGAGLVFANPANSFTLIATHNTISGGNDHGITTAGGVIMTTAHVTLSDNHITGNTNLANGVALSHEGTTLDFVATNNVIIGNDSSGILLYSSNLIENVTVSMTNNTISDNKNLASNTVGGIDLEQFTNLSAHLDGNSLSNNTGSDVFVGSADTSPSVCLEMHGNDGNGGYIISSGTGAFDLAPANAAAVNTGTITTIGTISPVQSCPP